LATTDIGDIVTEIRDRAGWSNGNAMQFFVEEDSCIDDIFLALASYENATYTQAELQIDFSYSFGKTTPTCDNVIYVSDKYATAALTHMYVWDGAAYSANLIENGAGTEIFDNPPAANDKVYFGSTAGPFNSVIMNVDGVGEDLNTIIWDYYQGAPTSSWGVIPGVSNRTSGFEALGDISFALSPPIHSTNGDWVAADLNSVAGEGAPPSVTAHWIRARLASVGGSPVVPTIIADSNNLYTATWPLIELGDTVVGGDIPALGWVSMSGGQVSTPRVERVIAAISSARGPYGNFESYDFSAYLPAIDEQSPSVIESITYSPGNWSTATDVTSPNGKAAQLNPAASPGTARMYWTINTLHFMGSYRAFVRARQDGGTDNDYQIRVQLANTQFDIYAETEYQPVIIQSATEDANWQLLDFGQIDIPPGLPAVSAVEGESMNLMLDITVNDHTGDLYIMDIILMPTDEWIVDVQGVGTQGVVTPRDLHIDSITIPKVDLRALTKISGTPSNAQRRPWAAIGSQMRLPANSAAKLWFLTAGWDSTNECWISEGHTLSKIQLYTAERYLGLRGER
jgi:hypothetical protein